MADERGIVLPTGPVHLAWLLVILGAATAALMIVDMWEDGSPLILGSLGLAAVGLLVATVGLRRLHRWAWILAVLMFGVIWAVGMYEVVWGGIFLGLLAVGYFVVVRELFLGQPTRPAE